MIHILAGIIFTSFGCGDVILNWAARSVLPTARIIPALFHRRGVTTRFNFTICA